MNELGFKYDDKELKRILKTMNIYKNYTELIHNSCTIKTAISY